jgi:2',3'-cyclic-nucleotide 2'-phosphodiesterase (5'-nucleotidase family)
VVLVDTGDALFAPEHGLSAPEQHRAALISRALSGLDYAALAVGEAELSEGVEGLRARGDPEGLPYLAANLVDGSGAHPFPATRLVQTPAGQVGLFAITLLEQPLAGLHSAEPVEAARAAISELRRHQVVAVIGVFHGSVARVQPLLTGLDLDVAVVGHDGRGGKLLDGPPTYGAGQKGRAVEVVSVELGPGPIEDATSIQDARDEVTQLENMIKNLQARDAMPQTTDAGHATFGVQLLRLRERRAVAIERVKAPHRARQARIEELGLGPEVPEDAALGSAVAEQIARDGHAPGH